MNKFGSNANYQLQATQTSAPQMNTRLQQGLDMYAAKKQIDAQMEILVASSKADALQRICLLREDAKVKRSLLATSVEICVDGTIRQHQELLMEPSKSYFICNAYLEEQPILYFPMSGEGEILFLQMRRDDEERIRIYLDMTVDDAAYFRRKFRSEGITFKRRQGTSLVCLDVIEACVVKARKEYLPVVRGFCEFCGRRYYYGLNQQIFAEVKSYAK